MPRLPWASTCCGALRCRCAALPAAACLCPVAWRTGARSPLSRWPTFCAVGPSRPMAPATRASYGLAHGMPWSLWVERHAVAEAVAEALESPTGVTREALLTGVLLLESVARGHYAAASPASCMPPAPRSVVARGHYAAAPLQHQHVAAPNPVWFGMLRCRIGCCNKLRYRIGCCNKLRYRIGCCNAVFWAGACRVPLMPVTLRSDGENYR